MNSITRTSANQQTGAEFPPSTKGPSVAEKRAKLIQNLAEQIHLNSNPHLELKGNPSESNLLFAFPSFSSANHLTELVLTDFGGIYTIPDLPLSLEKIQISRCGKSYVERIDMPLKWPDRLRVIHIESSFINQFPQCGKTIEHLHLERVSIAAMPFFPKALNCTISAVQVYDFPIQLYVKENQPFLTAGRQWSSPCDIVAVDPKVLTLWSSHIPRNNLTLSIAQFEFLKQIVFGSIKKPAYEDCLTSHLIARNLLDFFNIQANLLHIRRKYLSGLHLSPEAIAARDPKAKAPEGYSYHWEFHAVLEINNKIIDLGQKEMQNINIEGYIDWAFTLPLTEVEVSTNPPTSPFTFSTARKWLRERYQFFHRTPLLLTPENVSSLDMPTCSADG